jgi:carbon-monoxide dehydrogenase medium subunit
MKPARFTYEAPETLADALATLAGHGDAAKIIAGGQSLAPMMNMRIAQPGHLIDINRIPGLADVRIEGDHLRCGALIRHADLARDETVRKHAPILANAAGTIGHYAIRQRGTLGGSLAHADPAAQLPVVVLALDAAIEIASATGRRTIPAAEFFTSIFTTALAPHEMLVGVRIPLAGPREGWGFRLFTRRAGDFALALVACTLSRAAGGVEDLRLIAGGMAATPMRLDRAVRSGTGDAAWIAQAAREVAAAAPIEDNERISSDYRRELLEILVLDALADALERAA